MTRSEMITYFRELYNLSSHTNDGKLDTEIDVYLNLSQDKQIDDQFEEDEQGLLQLKDSRRAIDTLRTLMLTASLSLSADTEITNAKKASFPNDMRYYTGIRAQITRSDANPTQGWYLCNWIAPINVWKYVYNGKNSPIINNPFYSVFDNKIFIISESTSIATIDAGKIDYIKEPATIGSGQDCELPVDIHKQLVLDAVSIALKSSSVEPSDKLSLELQEDRQ